MEKSIKITKTGVDGNGIESFAIQVTIEKELFESVASVLKLSAESTTRSSWQNWISYTNTNGQKLGWHPEHLTLRGLSPYIVLNDMRRFGNNDIEGYPETENEAKIELESNGYEIFYVDNADTSEIISSHKKKDNVIKTIIALLKSKWN